MEKLSLKLSVNDLIITGNNSQAIDDYVAQLSCRFSLKDLGALNFFLGVEVINAPSSLFLSQHKYIRKPMLKIQHHQLAFNTQLKLHDGTSSANATEYRELLGSF